MEEPKYFSEIELKKVGVTLLYKVEDHICCCDKCGLTWMIVLKEDGALPNNYWTCPNECNDPERKRQYSKYLRVPTSVSSQSN